MGFEVRPSSDRGGHRPAHRGFLRQQHWQSDRGRLSISSTRKPSEHFCTYTVCQRAHLTRISTETRRGEWRGATENSGRCRSNAAECLLAAQEACQPYYRKLHLS